MQQLDGFDVELGDRLYDIYLEKWLTVTQLYSNRFMTSYGAARGPVTGTYNYQGVAARHHARTLYWHDPRLVIPAKGQENWDAQRQTLRSILSQVVQLNAAPTEALTSDPLATFEEALASRRAVDNPALPAVEVNSRLQAERDAVFNQRVAELKAKSKAQRKAAQ